MKPCPKCGYCPHPNRNVFHTKGEVLKAITDSPKTIDLVANELGLSYMTVAPILRKLRLENKIKRISKRLEGGKRAVYHYVRQLGTDNP